MDPVIAAIWPSALVFARVGAFFMLAPGVAEVGVPSAVRLAFSLLVAVAFGPLFASIAPEVPSTIGDLARLVIVEVLIGLAFGGAARLLLSALAVAGQIAGMQTGLSMAMAFDPAQGQQGALFAVFLNLTGLLLIFTLDLHHLLIAGLKGGYALAPIGAGAPVGDLADFGLEAFSLAFETGAAMMAPLLALGLVMNAGVGVLSKLMPQAQIFFLAMPTSILAGFAVLSATIGVAMMHWAEVFERFVRVFI